MPRKPRECIARTTYHVYSRCIENKPLLKPAHIKELLIKVINETVEKYEFELNQFDILDNHFHFMIRTSNDIDTISKIMQRLKSVFAKKYNRIHNRIGPFWNERFGSKIIENAKDKVTSFFNRLWYSAYNSVRKKYVSNPRDYAYSSINCYLTENTKCQVKITLHEYYFAQGKTLKDRNEVLLTYEEKQKYK